MKQKIYTLLVFLCFIIVLDRTHNPKFRQAVAEYAARTIMGESEQIIAFDDATPTLPFGLKLSNFKIQLPDGSFVTMDSFQIDGSPVLLLAKADSFPEINFYAKNIRLNELNPSLPQDLNILGSIKKDSPTKDYVFDVKASSEILSSSAEGKILLKDLISFEGQGKLQLKTSHNNLPIDAIVDLVWKNEEDIRLNAFEIDYNKSAIITKGSLNFLNKELHLTLNEFTVSDDVMADFPTLQANVHATLHNHHAEIEGDVKGMGKNSFKLSAKIPLNMHDSISGVLHGEIDLGTFLNAVAKSLPGLAGHAILDFNFSGSLDHPIVEGNASIVNGTYEGLITGVAIRDINASFTSTVNELQIVKLSGSDGKSGKIDATGHLTYDPFKAFPFELNVNVKDTLLFSIDDGYAYGDGTISLSGDMDQGKLSGNLNLNKIDIPIPKRIAPKVNKIDVTYINPPDDKPANAIKDKKSWPLKFDLKINTSSNILVHGRGLTSEWNGNLNVTGDDTQPLLNGEMKLVNGDYDLRGKLFKITRGIITFAGSLKKGTTVNVIAQRQLDRITTEILLKGPFLDPTLTLRSNPPLPQKEVLSLILFNQGTTDNSPSQGEELSHSLNSLIEGGGDTPDLLGTLRSRIGVDSVEINRSADGSSPSLKVGKYLTKDICVSVTKGISTDPNRVSVEATLMPHIKAEAEVGDDANGTLTLKWRKDY